MTARLTGLDKLADPAWLRVMSSALGARGEPNASLYMSKAATAIEDLLARNAALESALEPFAREYEAAGVDHLPDDARFGEVDCDQGQLTVGDLRQAALTLNKDTTNAEG